MNDLLRFHNIINKISESNSKNWLITKPDGNKIIIKNLEKYCKENNLQSSKMSLVASGIRNHHKGHLCQRMENLNEC